MTNVSAMGDPLQHHTGLSLKKSPIKIAIGFVIILVLIVIYAIGTKGQQNKHINDNKENVVKSKNKDVGNTAAIPQALQSSGQPSIPAADTPPPVTVLTPMQVESVNRPTRPTPPPPSLEEQLRAQQMQRLADFRTQQYLSALVADTEIQLNDNELFAAHSVDSDENRILQSQDKIQSLQSNLSGNPFISSAMAADQPFPQQDANGQQQKTSFLSQKRSDDYLEYTRDIPLSPYELNVGTIIPAVLISGMNSDIPGALIAQVSQNVYDSATGKYLLIPHGSKLYGVYDSNVSFGQSRGVSAWTRINFPDGTRLNLAGMGGMDVEGYSGFEDQVDNHFWKIFGNAALLGLISGATQAGVSDSDQEKNSNSAIADGVTQQFAQTGSTLIQKNLDVQPTIKIRPGYKFNIMVKKDIMLTPYKPSH